MSNPLDSPDLDPEALNALWHLLVGGWQVNAGWIGTTKVTARRYDGVEITKYGRVDNALVDLAEEARPIPTGNIDAHLEVT